MREFEAGYKRRPGSHDGKLVGSGPSKSGVLETVLRRPNAIDVMPETPLTLWDPRKQQVAAVQERLNAFYGTKALEVDGEFGPLTQQAGTRHYVTATSHGRIPAGGGEVFLIVVNQTAVTRLYDRCVAVTSSSRPGRRWSFSRL